MATRLSRNKRLSVLDSLEQFVEQEEFGGLVEDDDSHEHVSPDDGEIEGLVEEDEVSNEDVEDAEVEEEEEDDDDDDDDIMEEEDISDDEDSVGDLVANISAVVAGADKTVSNGDKDGNDDLFGAREDVGVEDDKDEMDIIDENEALDSPTPLDYEVWSALEYGWTGTDTVASNVDNGNSSNDHLSSSGRSLHEKDAHIHVPRKRESVSRRDRNRSSFHSAPSDHKSENGSEMDDNSSRRGNIAIAGEPRRRLSRRRTNVSVYGRSSSSVPDSTSSVGSASNSLQSSGRSSLIGVVKKFQSRHFSTRRASGIISESSESNSFHASMHHAATTLGSQPQNSNFADHVAAAAMVVAAGASQSKRTNAHYSVGDRVLALLSLLNVTNQKDTNDNFSVKPVNKYGYPQGEGRTEAERQGAHSYVMCTIKKVHFDEDERYFTVVRADTGTEQRADAGWMEPLRDPDGIAAASRAAGQTARAVADKALEKDKSFIAQCTETLYGACIVTPLRLVATFVPWYKRGRALAKTHVEDLLFGNPNYSFIFRVTGINVLVLCSFIFLFIDVAPLAFFPADWDYGIAIIGIIVWAILVIELILEYLIRSKSYYQDIETDKAYAPSTARNINTYHLIFEGIALILYVPRFSCIYDRDCGNRVTFLNIDSSLDAVSSLNTFASILGRLSLGISSLRLFGLIRHWKVMWINNTFNKEYRYKSRMLSKMFMVEYEGNNFNKSKSKDDDDIATRRRTAGNVMGDGATLNSQNKKMNSSEEDQRLKNAATIGTALLVVTSHRTLFLLTSIITILPMLLSFRQQNHLAYELTDLLQQNNCHSITDFYDDCQYLEVAIQSWVRTVAFVQPESRVVKDDAYILWAQVLPVRCPFQDENGVITNCNILKNLPNASYNSACKMWDTTTSPTSTTTSAATTETATSISRRVSLSSSSSSGQSATKSTTTPYDPHNVTREYFAEKLDIRVGGISKLVRNSTANASFIYPNVVWKEEVFSVTVFVNQNFTVAYTNMGLFILLASILLLALVGLTTLRDDAGRLVLDPLRRMLKIVVRYAENPLSNESGMRNIKDNNDNVDDKDKDENKGGKKSKEDQLGNYETEQLINAIAKIADLLRKCWGVAGAGIISSNLARDEQGKTVVFNPTVPGKRVYALFGFIAINGFSKQLHVLGSQVMILINDVAKVVHDEVYRWALLDSGQCNKNLGAAFLMVFRIGDFKDVHDKLRRATTIVFKAQTKSTLRNSSGLKKRKGRARGIRGSSRHLEEDTLQLASLPGIQSFTDRALLGMLKSFAGIHRDKKLRNWSKDFRLSAGIGSYHVDIIYGMDAGWAVEGAVGSEYKIDATYLSPHVNMASRMMSASKQYGVTILVSQAVEELLSKQARSKMRHLDTVYVKGSIVAQRIFTYDARHEGVDFFLIERTPDQADADAEAYTTAIWETDADLRAMRQHVTDEFMTKFKEGVQQYLYGDWRKAINTLNEADDLMIEAVLEEGYLDYDIDHVREQIFDRKVVSEEISRLRNEYGDGACKCLIQYMERRKGVAPKDWHGVRKLESK